MIIVAATIIISLLPKQQQVNFVSVTAVTAFSPTTTSNIIYDGKTMIPTTLRRKHYDPSRLCMVSQKEKRRLKEGNERTKDYQQNEIIMAQNQIIVEFRGILNAYDGESESGGGGGGGGGGDKSDSKKKKNNNNNNNNNKDGSNKQQEGEKKNKKKKNESKSKKVTRLLKNARHDGLDDIGMEARLLAMEIFYRTKNPSEMISLLKEAEITATTKAIAKAVDDDDNYSNSDNETNNRLETWDNYGLWAYSKVGDWKSAVPYAERIYNGNNKNADKSNLGGSGGGGGGNDKNNIFSQSQQSRNELQYFAIQAFSNTNQNTSIARELLLFELSSTSPSSPSPSATTFLINVLFENYIRNGRLQDAKSLFREIRSVRDVAGLTLTKTKKRSKIDNDIERSTTVLDDKSYDLILECARALGDVTLMDEVLAETEFCVSSSSSSSVQTVITTTTTTTAQLILILQTFAMSTALSLSSSRAIGTEHYLSKKHQIMARSTIQLLLVKQERIDPALLSSLLIAFPPENDNDDLKCVAKACREYYYENNKNSKDGILFWHSPLNNSAKLHILPALLKWEEEEDCVTSSTDGNSRSNGNMRLSDLESWNVFISLFDINQKTGNISEFCRQFFRKQISSNRVIRFLQYADYAFENYEDITEQDYKQKGDRICQTILQECWNLLIANGLDIENSNLQSVVRMMMKHIVRIPDESTRFDLFVEWLKIMTVHVSSLSSAQQYQSNDENNHTDNTSFSNTKLNTIVPAVEGFFQAISQTITVDTTQTAAFKNVSITVSIEAMSLVSTFNDFSPKYNISNKKDESDNGVKEALQSILRALLQPNMCIEDDDLLNIATVYYWSLVHVARSSSVIDNTDLLFPLSYERQEEFIKQLYRSANDPSPYDDFRNCVYGKDCTKRSNVMQSIFSAIGNTFSVIDFVTGGNLQEISTNDYKEDKDISLILQLICEMAMAQDGNYRTTFVKNYQDHFSKEREDLFFDTELYYGLCQSFENACNLFPKETQLPAAITLTAAEFDDMFWFSGIWSSDLAECIIERLATCDDANRFLSLSYKDDPYNGCADSCCFLVTLYSKAGVFYKIGLDSESRPIGEAYMNACTRNTQNLVNIFMGETGVKINRRQPSGKKMKDNKEKAAIELLTMMRCIASLLGGMPSTLLYNILPSGDSFVKYLVDDILDAAWGLLSHQANPILLEVIEKLDLDPLVDIPARAWVARKLEKYE